MLKNRLFPTCCSRNLSQPLFIVLYLMMSYRTTHHHRMHIKYTDNLSELSLVESDRELVSSAMSLFPTLDPDKLMEE